MAVKSVSELLNQVRSHQAKQFEPRCAEQWHLLRAFWARYSAFNQKMVLKLADIEGEPRDLAAYSQSDIRKIAQRIRDILAFAAEDNALNGKDRKLWRALNQEFLK